MKKIGIIGVLFMLVWVEISAQTNIGFVAGGINTHHTDVIDHFKKSNDFGINAGLCLEQKLTKHATLGVNALVSYSKNVIEADSIYRVINPYYHNLGAGGSVHAEYKSYGISIPLFLEYKINRFSPFLGIQLELAKNDFDNRDYGEYQDYYDDNGNIASYGDAIYLKPGTFDYGWLAGVECNITHQIGIRLSYFRGMNDALVYNITKGIYNGEGGTTYQYSTRKASVSLNLVYTPDWSKLKSIKLKKNKTQDEKPLKNFLKELY